jgi:hypothetical protein
VTIAPDGHWIDLPHYDSPDSAEVDRYARLSWSDGCLSLREGLIDEHGTRQMLTDTVICDDVSDCVFTESGASVRMKLTLTESVTQMTVVAAAMTTTDSIDRWWENNPVGSMPARASNGIPSKRLTALLPTGGIR